jgi:hypothetical protein
MVGEIKLDTRPVAVRGTSMPGRRNVHFLNDYFLRGS